MEQEPLDPRTSVDDLRSIRADKSNGAKIAAAPQAEATFSPAPIEKRSLAHFPLEVFHVIGAGSCLEAMAAFDSTRSP